MENVYDGSAAYGASEFPTNYAYPSESQSSGGPGGVGGGGGLGSGSAGDDLEDSKSSHHGDDQNLDHHHLDHHHHHLHQHQLHHQQQHHQQQQNCVMPKIVIMGLRRSGKSSIQKVVFHKLSPNETLFLESTDKVVKEEITNNTYVSFTIYDFPGQIDITEREVEEVDNVLRSCGALIYVIDSQEDYNEPLNNLYQTFRKAHSVNPNINFEVFIHKVDGLSDDHKIEARQEIHQRTNDELVDSPEFGDNINLNFYLTSIYDYSIFEAFSKVIQKLIPQLPILENLLNVFISNSNIEKAFLFDVVSKIFIATDSSPVDMQSYELCCDMIDVVIDISCIYGVNENGEGSSFDEASSAAIHLNSGTVLYLREVNKFLAIVCILREENFTKQGLIDFNFKCLRNSIQDVFRNQRCDGGGGGGGGSSRSLLRSSDTNPMSVSTPYGSSNTYDNEVSGLAARLDAVDIVGSDPYQVELGSDQDTNEDLSGSVGARSSSSAHHHHNHTRNMLHHQQHLPSQALQQHQSQQQQLPRQSTPIHGQLSRTPITSLSPLQQQQQQQQSFQIPQSPPQSSSSLSRPSYTTNTTNTTVNSNNSNHTRSISMQHNQTPIGFQQQQQHATTTTNQQPIPNRKHPILPTSNTVNSLPTGGVGGGNLQHQTSMFVHHHQSPSLEKSGTPNLHHRVTAEQFNNWYK